MTTSTLLTHGQRIRREYAAPPGEAADAAGASIDNREAGRDRGLAARFSKTTPTSQRPLAAGWIRAVFSEAIEYTSITRELRGMGFLWAIFASMVLSPMGFYCVFLLLEMGAIDDLFPWVLAFLLFAVMAAFSSFMFAFMLRMDLFRPLDLPIIFDRKNRKIYRLLRDEVSGFTGAFKRWPVLACQYEWDLVDAEHHRQVFTTGGSVNTNHFLVFLVRKSAEDPTIIDSFTIAHPNVLSNEIVGSFWEHIRRFMEEGGPHLPTPNEPLADVTPTATWWDSMGAVGPFGAGYREHWGSAPVYTFIMHLFSPLSLPFFLIWGTGNYLSYRTAINVQWPAEVLNAIGPRKV